MDNACFDGGLTPVKSLAIRLDGELEIDTLGRSIDEIVRRHAALQSPASFGRPRPRAGALPRVGIKLLRRSGITEAERNHEILRQAEEEAQRPFDLDRGPLLRATLVRFEEAAHALLVTAHRSALDDESAEIFVEELGAIYECFAAGRPSLLPEPSLEEADLESLPPSVHRALHLAYWREHLAGELPTLELTTDHPRPPIQSRRGAVARREIPPVLVEALHDLCRREGVTLFVALLAAFAALLHRHTDQDDILIGTPHSSRRHPVLEGVIGGLGYPLPVRARLHGDMSFQRLLQEIAVRVAAADAHGGASFAAILEDLRPAADPSRHPVFQAAFELKGRPAVVALPDLTLTLLTLDEGAADLDLALSVRPGPQGLEATLAYSADLFEADTAERMLARLHILLAGVAADPERPIADLPLLTGEERHRILVEWNDTQTDYPKEACVHDLFAARAAEAPDAVAARCGGEEITYRELNRRANRLGRRLQALGVGPDVPVGVFIERSLDGLVALLGVLKAGGAYVPLDPQYPDERLHLMLNDAAISVLLGRPGATARLSFRGEIVDLDDGAAPTSTEDDWTPASGAGASHLAYVMFTSGSTGHPKGVAVPHRAVVRLVTRTNYVDLGPTDRVMQAASLSFDASTFEVWGALLNGARLVIVDHETLLSPGALTGVIQREGVTAMFLTTPLFHHLATLGKSPFAGLSYLFVGGEILDPRSAKAALEKGAPRRLINIYGPTENTTFSTFHPFRDGPIATPSVPIGRPISNTRAYVLDRRLRPVPVGVPGELYVGGDGLARGYLNRPELTRDRFIKNPIPEEPGEHLYRTGDRVRHLPDGSLEFLGRLDSQVKIRGFRVEIGEIESELSGCPTVRDAVVALREDAPGDKRLVAYVASNLVSDRIPLYSMCRAEIDRMAAVDVMTKDISPGGVGLLDVPGTWRQGQSLRLRLRLPGAPADLWLSGVVAWRKDRRAGVQFKLLAHERSIVQQSLNHALETQANLKTLQRAVIGNLRCHLREKLPEYMLPASFVVMRALPLSPSGKLDRLALPPPAPDQPGPEEQPSPMSPVEERVARIFAQILNIGRASVRDNFFDLGGNSILAVKLLIHLEEVFQIELSMRRLLDSPTVGELAAAIEEDRRGSRAREPARRIDLRAEAVLDEDIRPAGPRTSEIASPRHVFLTGATGFLGAFLLREILQRTSARVHCLVRAPSALDGLSRIKKSLEAYALWDEAIGARIIPVPGDLGMPLLGLPPGQFAMLAEQIDVIYHGGAEINYVKPYSAHRATNVLGTREVLRLACLSRAKPLHYISTISVFGNIGYFTGAKVVREDDDLGDCEDHLYTDMGYSQSKWVAERLVWIARARGAPVSVYRPGFIMGHSATGAANLNDFACRMIKGSIKLGSVPELPDQSKEFVSVDFVSRAIVHLSQRESSLGRAFHLVPPPSRKLSLMGFFDLISEYGYPLKKLPYAAWQHDLLEQLKRWPDNPLLPLVPTLAEPVHDGLTRWELCRHMPVYDCQNTLAGLEGTTIRCPRMDASLIHVYLSHFIRSGFLAPPPSAPDPTPRQETAGAPCCV